MLFLFIIMYCMNCLISYFWFYDTYKGDDEGPLRGLDHAQVIATAIFHPLVYLALLVSIIQKVFTNR